MEEVILSKYTSEWEKEYNHEKEKITRVLRPIQIGIEHIGSTSVPGLKAKPTIDIMVGIKDLKDLNQTYKDELKNIGYEYVHHPDFQERLFLRKGKWRAGTHHLHVYKHNGSHWLSNLLFKNYLIKHPKVLRKYQLLKEQLSDVHKNDRVQYTKAKEPFILNIIELAKKENDCQ
ncbi:GrpB family protein [Chengkuizengella axinellae]|uniref:GrpB family protein n=1 Tax=Chengkuizengella axinellae TaxID=3064388 RepID=A0ABT9IY70_9BACL|nr:GrpB family protein [Chengkuizengella sp. 2205SS18-9]MDP5274198.1 GrpB family protein [Chengkuizengella sp. 2205SS18-9]